MIKFDFEFKKALSALDGFSQDIETDVNKTMSKEADAIVKEAKAKHRFKTRTGRLKNSVKQITKDYSTQVYIDDARAPYGYFIHEGHSSWAPDPFVEEAFNKHTHKIEHALDQALKKAIKKNGLE